jgi:hypothetical protein
MNAQMRYDYAAIKAQITEDGYLEDSPIIARIGVQQYKRADGTIRKELRLPEDVFNADSLKSFAGKPITDDHPPEAVTAKNFKKYGIGVISGPAYQDGETNVKAKIIIHDGVAVDKAMKGGKRELSVGYTVVLDETPGVWNGEQYDAIQRSIRVNHLSLVQRGRAGNARLNLDRHDAVSFNSDEEINNMSTVDLGRLRLDSGLEYPAAPEVVLAYEKLHKDLSEKSGQLSDMSKKHDAICAERDTLKAQVASAEKVRADALELARKEVKERAELDKVAESFKVDGKDKSDRQVKELIIKTLRADADLSSKSDEYVNAAFDMTVAVKQDSAMATQRGAVGRKDSVPAATNSYSKFKADLNNLHKKETA